MGGFSAGSKVPRTGIPQRSAESSSPFSPATASSRHRPVEHFLKETPAAPQPVLIDRMGDTCAGHRLDWDSGAFERGFRLGERAVRHERVVSAVNKERTRTRAQLARQQLGGQQPARTAYNAGDRPIAPEP